MLYKKNVLSFDDFLKESLINEDESKLNIDPKNVYELYFEEGKYKKDDLDPKEVEKIKNNLTRNIIAKLDHVSTKKGAYITKVEIHYSAGTSAKPVGPKLGKELSALKLEPNNKGLAQARMRTIADIVKEAIYNESGFSGEEFKKEIEGRIIFIPEELEITTSKMQGNEDGSKFQKIWCGVKVRDIMLSEIKAVGCTEDPFEGKGKKGDVNNNFIGYEAEKMLLKVPHNERYILNFDSKIIPDCLIYKYGNKIKITPFIGSKVSTKSDRNFKKELNEINKDGAIVKAIENIIREKFKSNESLKEICPDFFDADGKIKIYDPRTLPENVNKSLTITKKALRSYLSIVVVSPLDDTIFTISGKCQKKS